MTNSLHAHFESYTTDCDGPITREYVLTMTDDEKTDGMGDLHFCERVLCSVANVYGLFRRGTLRIECEDEGSDEKTLTWNEVTEEGTRHVVARICSDDCDTGETTYRDHRAEAAGY